jgi:flavin reductase (DIM6/NTAB) family NADH-FMN oxidoreductase RutF
MSRDSFAGVCDSLDYPMTIVTAFDGRERSGCLVGFQTQCSIAPRRWIVCISKTNHTFAVAGRSEWLIVHLLREDQHGLAQFFGAVTGDAIAPHEKFEYAPWHPGPGGTPILEGCDWLAGRILERIDGGDHVAYLLEITEAGEVHAPARQLGSLAARDIQPGHAP